MSIEVNDDLIGIWWCHWIERDGQEVDYLCGLSRAVEGFKISYRFRYYANPEPWSQQDRKSWWSGTAKSENEQTAIDGIRQVLNVICAMKHTTHDELLKGSLTTDEFMAQLEQFTWAHKRELNLVKPEPVHERPN